MDKVRIGIVGLGVIGTHHATYLLGKKVKRGELTAVCDAVPDRLKRYEGLRTFTDARTLIHSGEVDAVLIATPHYDHTTTGIAALEHGLHVLVEKPLSVHKADCERLLAAHKRRKQVFAIMFNLRADPLYRKVKRLVENGDIGEIARVTWIITDWFRTAAYYASGGWRATWAGEGGGVLTNQCPHQLDVLQWLCGLPRRVHGFCKFGARHNIEVEDEVTAYLEYSNGATGVFITSTGEAPGTNRLEIAGDNGKVVVEDGKITFIRNEVPTTEFSRTSTMGFARPETWTVDIPVSGPGGQHEEITQNFVNAILDGEELLAPAAEGIRSVELANAMVYSAWLGKPVDIPLDGRAYEKELKKRIASSRFRKQAVKAAKDMAGS